MPNFIADITFTTTQTLDAGELGIIVPSGSLSVISGSGIVVSGSSVTIDNLGSIISARGDGVFSGNNTSGLEIMNTGVISGRSSGISSAASFNAINLSVNNTGTIIGTGAFADGILATSGGVIISNSGTITTLGDNAIQLLASGTFSASNLIVNNGLISRATLPGAAIAYTIELAEDIDVILNSGRIVGDVSMGAGNDVFDGRGGIHLGGVFAGAGADVLTGGSNGDRMAGGDNADVIRTNAGDDVLAGGAGNDALFGGDGDDALVGGLGIDRLTGGRGADMFDFNTVSTSITGARDVIADFQRGSDDFDVVSIDARANAAGNQAFVFIGAAAFTAQGQIRIIVQGANVVVQANTSGTLAADFEVFVLGVGTLAAGDFLL